MLTAELSRVQRVWRQMRKLPSSTAVLLGWRKGQQQHQLLAVCTSSE